MAPTLTLLDDALALDISGCRRGAEFADALAKVKEIPGARFDWDTKLWMLPAEPAIGERALLAIQPEVTPELRNWIRAGRATADAELVAQLPPDADDLLIPWAHERAPWQPEEINGSPVTGLKPHQRALVSTITKQRPFVRAIVADEMGIGKTIQAISIIAELQVQGLLEVGPKLVVCPNSVKGVWAREILRWLGDDEPVQIVAGTPAQRKKQIEAAVASDGWLIVNYEQVRTQKVKRRTRSGGTKTVEIMKEPLFETTEWLAVIADEAHRTKNRKAAQTRGLWRTTKSGKVPVQLAATGTPIMNSPDELWALLHWLFPKEYTSYWAFYEKYVDYTEGYFGKEIHGVKNADALRFELKGRLFRRTKAQVLDLPAKTRITIPIELSAKARKLYAEAERSLWLEVEKAMEAGDASAEALAVAATRGTNIYTIPNGAARTVRLRQILSTTELLGGEDESDKLDACVDNITDNAHKQHVVFSEFVGTCQALARRLRAKGMTAEVYTGEVGQAKRTELEDKFQRGEIDVLIGTIGAMREGITLTASDTQHWIERAWVPAWNEQGEDRQHRIGMTGPLTIYIYEAQDTLDDGRVKPTNALKARIVRSVITQDEVAEK